MNVPEIRENGDFLEIVYRITKKAAIAYHKVRRCIETNSGMVIIDDIETYNEIRSIIQNERNIVCDFYWKEMEDLKLRLQYLSDNSILKEKIEGDGIGKTAESIMDIVCPLLIVSKNKPAIFRYVDKDLDIVVDELTEFLSDDYKELFKCICNTEKYMCENLFNGWVILLSFMTLRQKEQMFDNYLKIKTYLMLDDSGLYKIGQSVDPRRRLEDIKCGNPSVKLICIIDDDIEKELHEKYSKQRVTGEWFNLTAKQVNEIIKLSKQKCNK